MIKLKDMDEFLAAWPKINRGAIDVLKNDPVVAARVTIEGRIFNFLINRPNKSHRDFIIAKYGIDATRLKGSFGIFDWEKKAAVFSDKILLSIVDLVEQYHGVLFRDDSNFELYRVPHNIIEKMKGEYRF